MHGIPKPGWKSKETLKPGLHEIAMHVCLFMIIFWTLARVNFLAIEK